MFTYTGNCQRRCHYGFAVEGLSSQDRELVAFAHRSAHWLCSCGEEIFVPDKGSPRCSVRCKIYIQPIKAIQLVKHPVHAVLMEGAFSSA